ncbi:hypothetical protein [Streptosporangium pseudovulgare]|uniref:DDE Tnp4 domain-containing protein n=1 Tax=Streptosporangium pseudovulgare TaxID=35765 RepID=A0ABQ2RKF5_9ACTN|nr:hypothetical protein [Streptosporangium pseudovulgare]GGQ34507.1 hypothetical protein GCM10010140_75600 [Streptosporangium pseudovulgare]
MLDPTMVETPSPPPGLDALAALRERLQELYRYHGKPGYRELAKRTGNAVSHTTAHAVIRCQKPPRWGQPEFIVERLKAVGRASVEHGFAHLKTWSILTELRTSPARAANLLRALLVLTNLELDR